MRIVALQKEVPDTYGDRRIDTSTGRAVRLPGESVVDEIGERALELALTLAASEPGSEVVVLTMGPASAAESLRKSLAAGADRAVHVLDDALAGADLATTALVLAAAIRRLAPDLVVTGNLSTDGSGGVLPAMLAELLGLPHATNLAAVRLAGGAVVATRVLEHGTETVEASLPVVVSITEALPALRFTSFKGILAAKKKPLDTWDTAALGVDPEAPGVSRSIVIGVAERPARSGGTVVRDDGTAGRQLADYLVSHRLV